MDRLFTANEKLAQVFSEKVDGCFGPERNGAGVGQEHNLHKVYENVAERLGSTIVHCVSTLKYATIIKLTIRKTKYLYDNIF